MQLSFGIRGKIVQCRLDQLASACRFYSKHGLTELKGRKVAAQNWLIRQSKDPYVRRAREENYRCRSAFKLLEIDDKHDLLKPGGKVIDLGAAPGSWSQVAAARVNALHVDKTRSQGRVISVDIQHMKAIDGSTVLSCSDFTQSHIQQLILQLLGQKLEHCHRLVVGSIDNHSDVAQLRNFVRHDGDSSITSPDHNLNNLTHVTEKRDKLCQNIVSNDLLATEEKNGNDEQENVMDRVLANVILSDMAPSASGYKSLDHQVILKLAASVLRFSLSALEPRGCCLIKLWQGSDTEKLVTAAKKCFTDVQIVKPPSSRSDSAEIFLLAQNFNL